MYRTVAAALLLAGSIMVSALSAAAGAEDVASPARESHKADVVYVPTPNDVVLRMLDLAKVGKDDVIYDLGCGDGRIVVLAAKKYGCRGVGYDIDPNRIKECHASAKTYGVEDLVRFEQKNIFELDLRPASVITLYLLPRLNVKLIPQLEKLKPGSRIVSHDFDMRGVKEDKTVLMMSKEDNVKHRIYLWTTPLKKEGAGRTKVE
ncbi:MAG: class I SAM-dependent methyltransferase [Thermoguttaceae bacterium]